MHTSPLMGHRPQEGHYEDKHAHNPRRRDSTDRHAHAHTVRTTGKHRNAEITQKDHGSVAPSASVVTFNRRPSVDVLLHQSRPAAVPTRGPRSQGGNPAAIYSHTLTPTLAHRSKHHALERRSPSCLNGNAAAAAGR